MLTVLEKIQQKKLKNAGADSFELDYLVVSSRGEELVHKISVFSENEADALDLGEKIRFRHQEDINSGDTVAEKWGLHPKEIMDNKWGLINPFKDPVYKRSWKNGTSIPKKQFVLLSKSIVTTLGKRKEIAKENIDLDGINKKLSKCLLSIFSALFIMLCSIVSLIVVLSSDVDLISPQVLGALTIMAYAGLTFAQANHNRKTLVRWKGELNVE